MFATFAAPAQATVRKGAASDRQGDTAAGARYDIIVDGRAGRRQRHGGAIGVQLAATPASGMYLVGLLGTTNGASCGATVCDLLGRPVERGGGLRRETGGQRGRLKAATMNVDGHAS